MPPEAPSLLTAVYQQSWSLVCIIIEIVVEAMVILLYAIVFYRYYTKRRLHKSMDTRDKARSDLYLAQLRTQSAPNTPGFGPKTPGGFSQYALSPRRPPSVYRSMSGVADMSGRDGNPLPFTPGGNGLVVQPSRFGARQEQAPARAASGSGPSAFQLQAPPTKANPAVPSSQKPDLSGYGDFHFDTAPDAGLQSEQHQTAPSVGDHAPPAAGEQQYEAVPIPGAYVDQAIKSPQAAHTSFGLSR